MHGLDKLSIADSKKSTSRAGNYKIDILVFIGLTTITWVQI